MSTKAEKDRQKQIQDKCQNLLEQMLRDDDNKYCVDCDAKGPRWASWNLGVFLCIRCAGIHRNLGVHISKVKSVNLDTWTPEQVVSLQNMGNSRARAVYEAELPDNFRRPQTDSALETFIRSKYESKKYIAKEWVPPPLPKVNWDKELEEEERARKKKREVKNTTLSMPSAPRKLENVIPQPLPKPTTSPKTQRTATPPKQPVSAPQPSTDLLGLDTPVTDCGSGKASGGEEDVFSSFLSAQPTPQQSQTAAQAANTTGSKRSKEEESFFNQEGVGPPGGDRRMTTDSILALYAKNPPIPNQQNPYQQGMGYLGQQPAGFHQYQMPNGTGMLQQPQSLPGNMFSSSNTNLASNPFYSIGTQQGYQPNRLPQQLVNLSLNGPSGANSPSQQQNQPAQFHQHTLSNKLWQ